MSTEKKSTTDGANRLRWTFIVGLIVDYRWIIIGITALFTIAGLLYSLWVNATYSAEAMVKIERKNADLLSSSLQYARLTAPAADTEVHIIKSRQVIGKTVRDLSLDIDVQPRYSTFVQRVRAQLTGEKRPQIGVTHLKLPPDWSSPQLTLEIADARHFKLLKKNKLLLLGQTGKSIAQDGLEINVAWISANPGTRFTLTKLTTIGVIKRMLKQLYVADMGKDSGVLSLKYLDEDPIMAQAILAQIVDNYLQQDIDRKTAYAEKSAQFLQRQLPKIKQRLTEAESKLNQFRQVNASVDVPLEARVALESAADIQSQLNQITFKEAEISQLFTQHHPTYYALVEKRKVLEKELAQLQRKIAQIPLTEQEIARLTRDVESGRQIYMQLLTRQQELNIARASTISDISIIDKAEANPQPVAPKQGWIVMVALIGGFLFAVSTVMLRALFHDGIEGAEQLERLGLSVYATVPLSQWQRHRDSVLLGNKRQKRRSSSAVVPLVVDNPSDLVAESLRGFRTSLHFTMMNDAPNNVVMLTGASPRIGKTFISANLAALIAQSGQRILLIDGDLRSGYIHTLFSLESKVGLTDVLTGKVAVDDNIVQHAAWGLHVITRGQPHPSPAELLMNARMPAFMAWAASQYDLVIIDTPPILAVTDASIIGKYAGTSFMVVRYATNNVKEVDVSIKRFAQNGINIKGCILNAVVRKAGNAYDHDYNYGNDYQS